jgi:predicted DNA-binding transcriptional regulator YafY
MIENYVGRTVQIIYNDRKGNISFRDIQVRSVRNGKVSAYCFNASAPRVFNVESIIDVELIKQHA